VGGGGIIQGAQVRVSYPKNANLKALEGLEKALALFVPIASRLLLLKHLGSHGAGNASSFFNADRLKLLRAYGVTKKCFRLS
jgi:hypothetical protein